MEKIKTIETAHSKKTTADEQNQLEKKTALSRCKTNCKSISMWQLVVIMLLLINIVTTIILSQSNQLKSIIKETEALKVWGMENYEKLEKIMDSETFKRNYSENIDMMMLQMEQAENGESLWNQTPDILPYSENEEKISNAQKETSNQNGNIVLEKTWNETNLE